MEKNIIICCDGTGNQFGEENSNVVKLYMILKKEIGSQIAFYDPGVGTMSDPGIVTPFAKKLSKICGFAFGFGLRRNVEEAYSYLMENYEAGDQIFLFGFSRGAYTVRALAGLIHKCGLLEKGCQNLIPYAYTLFKNGNKDLAMRFRKTYARTIKIHFMGIWDTVSSVGWIGKRRTFPYTAKNPTVEIVRHAVSIDERRAYYRQNLCKAEDNDVKQVWFAGVHSDIGGSYPEKQSGLSKITLKWMIDEAKAQGLQIDNKQYNKIALGLGNDGKYAKPDHKAMIHQSLAGIWWVLEFLPKNYTLKQTKFFIPRGKRRSIKNHSIIHRSVIDKMRDDAYQPDNLPEAYHIEE